MLEAHGDPIMRFRGGIDPLCFPASWKNASNS
jgi:hypothetical protein